MAPLLWQGKPFPQQGMRGNMTRKFKYFPPLFKKDFIYLFPERGEGRETEERNIDRLPRAHPRPGTWAPTQACALTRN